MWIEPFLQMMAAERNAAKNTLEAYRRDLLSFQEFLGKKPLEETTKDDVDRFLQVQSQILHPSSCARRISALKQFFQFLVEEGTLVQSPILHTMLPKVPKRIPRVPTLEHIQTLLAYVHQEASRESDNIEKDFTRKRLACLLELVYGSGLRASELLSLKRQQMLMHQDHPQFLISGKGGKERLVPVSKASLTCVQAYLPARDAYLKHKGRDDCVFAFPSHSRRTSHIGPLSRHRFFQMVKHVCSLANVDPAMFSPHTFRHAFATHLLEGGAGILEVQNMLGHASVASTQVYTHVATKRLQETLLQYHPLSYRHQLENATGYLRGDERGERKDGAQTTKPRIKK